MHSERLHRLLHDLWTIAVGGERYVKADWFALEQATESFQKAITIALSRGPHDKQCRADARREGLCTCWKREVLELLNTIPFQDHGEDEPTQPGAPTLG